MMYGKEETNEVLENFKANFLSRYSDTNIKTMMFNGVCHGSGCSMTALKCATALTFDSMRKVLLVNVNINSEVYKHGKYHADIRNIGGYKRVTYNIEKVGPGELYKTNFKANSLCGPTGDFESGRLEGFLSSIYDHFEHIIVDAPPVVKYSQLLIMCKNMDGVVMVIESGSTRRPIALRAKNKIEDAGGKILGVVINKRRYYIPQWIYKML